MAARLHPAVILCRAPVHHRRQLLQERTGAIYATKYDRRAGGDMGQVELFREKANESENAAKQRRQLVRLSRQRSSRFATT